MDNLKCFGKLANEADPVCIRSGESLNRGQQFAEALNEKGLISISSYENDTFGLYHCMYV